MLPRHKNGVVDPNLKVCPEYNVKELAHNYRLIFQVYGTTNVRVVDISVFPIQIAAHTHGKL